MNRYFSMSSLLLAATFICGCNSQPASIADEAKAPEVYLKSQQDSTYHLTFAGLQVEVAPQKGGRITSLKMGGKELFASVDTLSFGSTFWPSPQSAWGWPPSYILDAAPYTATATGNTLKMVSQRDEQEGWQFEKEVSLLPEDTAVSITYTIRNIADTVQHVAPWQNSRVVTNGLVFFPKGELPLAEGMQFKNIPTQEADGVVRRCRGLYREIKPELYRDRTAGCLPGPATKRDTDLDGEVARSRTGRSAPDAGRQPGPGETGAAVSSGVALTKGIFI